MPYKIVYLKTDQPPQKARTLAGAKALANGWSAKVVHGDPLHVWHVWRTPQQARRGTKPYAYIERVWR